MIIRTTEPIIDITNERDDNGLKYQLCTYQSGITGWLCEYDQQQQMVMGMVRKVGLTKH